MAEFHRVQSGTYFPSSCAFCGDGEGPFVDCCVDLVGYGHVYVCASTDSRLGCIIQLAREDGMIPLRDVIDYDKFLEGENTRLELELEESLKEKVVPLPDVLAYLAGGPGEQLEERDGDSY